MLYFMKRREKKPRLSLALYPLGLLSLIGGTYWVGNAMWLWIRSRISHLDTVMDGALLLLLGIACIVFAEWLERRGARRQNNPYKINTYGGTRWKREEYGDTYRQRL